MEEQEKKAQEAYMQFQMLEQQIKQLQSQFEMVSQQLIELAATSNSLDDFQKIRDVREAFIPISSGIFARASIKDTSELLVNVGANVVVKKDLASTKKLILSQMEEIKKIQKQMGDELERTVNHAAQLEIHLQNLIPK